MRRIDEIDIRKAGLIQSSGHYSYKTAKQLMNRLSEVHDKIKQED